MAKIKILRILHRASVSGPTHHAAILQQYFNNENFESKLLVGKCLESEKSGEYILNQKKAEYTTLQFSRTFNILSEIRSIRKIYGEIRKYRPDIIHTHASKPGFYGRILGRILGVKIIIHTYHGHVFHSYFGYFKTSLIKCIEYLLGKISTRIITISDLQKYDIENAIGNKNKLVVIPLGLDLEKFLKNESSNRDQFRKKTGLKKEFCIGYSGRLTAIKDIYFLLQIFEYIRTQKAIDCTLIIAGGGEEEKNIRDFINSKSELKNNVKLIGWQNQMEEFYHGIDCLFLTSKNEGTPVCLIEAIASGLNCFSTNVGGVQNIFENIGTGYLISERTVEAFAESFTKFYNTHTNKRLSGELRLHCKKVYGFENLTSNIEKLYLNLLHE